MNPQDVVTTTAGLQAKVSLRRAWFEAHPNQPIPEGKDEVEALFDAIEAEAKREAEARLVVVTEALRSFTKSTYTDRPDLYWASMDWADHVLSDSSSAAQDDRVTKAVEALRRYGAHDHSCPAEMPSPFTGRDQGCTCGLVETWAALKEHSDD